MQIIKKITFTFLFIIVIAQSCMLILIQRRMIEFYHVAKILSDNQEKFIKLHERTAKNMIIMIKNTDKMCASLCEAKGAFDKYNSYITKTDEYNNLVEKTKNKGEENDKKGNRTKSGMGVHR